MKPLRRLIGLLLAFTERFGVLSLHVATAFPETVQNDALSAHHVEKVLERLGALERGFLNTKTFLVEDALVIGPRWLDHDRRINRLEDGKEEL